MTEKKWTPGPWSVEYKYGETRLIANGEVIMCDMTYYPWVPENDADWHLIASAPELYEALDIMCKFIETGSWPDRDPVHIAQSALAKARGEQ